MCLFEGIVFLILFPFTYICKMKTSIRNIAEDILTRVRGGGPITDDENFAWKQLYFEIDNYRAKLIRERYKKDGVINPNAYQDLGCIQTTCKDISDCCPDQKIYWGQKVYQVILPELILLGEDNGLSFLGFIDKQTRIPILQQGYSKYKNFSPYTKNRPFAFVNTNVINIFSRRPIKYINVQAILKNPLDANKFCTGDACLDEFSPYPIDSTIIPTLQSLILQDVFNLELLTNPDTNNDAQGDYDKTTGKGQKSPQAKQRGDEDAE